MKRFTILITIFIIVSVLILSSCSAKSPEGTLKRYFKAIMREDYETAYSLLAGDMLKEKGSLEDFKKSFENMKEHNREIVGVRIEDVVLSNDKKRARVHFVLTIRENGKESDYRGAYILILHDDGWKIEGSIF
ncbi:MAG: hypothetical protein DRI28_00850 [Caldiserica bacterium]|nr:MAG: hypothetical protein DRI28_00850 [Caldisericota bacterium]